MVDGALRFVAKDACKILEINKYHDAVKRLGIEGIPVRVETLGGIQKMTTINEAGLYRLIMRSDKPQAVTFQNWIATEVLPTIRKKGMYVTPEVAQEIPFIIQRPPQESA